MRIHPFVLYAYFNFLNETEEGYWKWMGCIKAGSELTHAHDRSIMGCYIYGYCLSFLLKEATRESLLAGIKFAGEDLDYLPEFEPYHRIFEPDFEKLPREEIRSTGYVVDTLEAALWCVLTTDSYRDCVLKAINLGDDTDTVAAVAGSLAGVMYGLEKIPLDWLEKLKKRDYIENMCEKACNSWNNMI
jgi:ADP-ribosylglycohydrolase